MSFESVDGPYPASGNGTPPTMNEFRATCIAVAKSHTRPHGLVRFPFSIDGLIGNLMPKLRGKTAAMWATHLASTMSADELAYGGTPHNMSIGELAALDTRLNHKHPYCVFLQDDKETVAIIASPTSSKYRSTMVILSLIDIIGAPRCALIRTCYPRIGWADNGLGKAIEDESMLYVDHTATGFKKALPPSTRLLMSIHQFDGIVARIDKSGIIVKKDGEEWN